MISGFARAVQVLGDERYLEVAEKAARFIKQHLYKSERGGVLLRSAYRDQEGSVMILGLNIPTSSVTTHPSLEHRNM